MQGSIEVSHKAFKAALVKWLDKKTTDNWILGASTVQCEVNNCPIRARWNISSHTIYYGKPPIATYSAILGPSYKIAKTEYGLWLAKRVLQQVKLVQPYRLIECDLIEKIIAIGDNSWMSCADDLDYDP
jgi:hypothetical protein